MHTIKTYHVLGRTLFGERVRYHGGIGDEEFEREVASKGLPLGWFAYHFQADEINNSLSLRVQGIRRLPVAKDDSGRNRSWKADLAEARELGS